MADSKIPELRKDELDSWVVPVAIIVAYIFSCAIRWMWISHFEGTESFYWNGVLNMTSRDSYFWSSMIQYGLNGQDGMNPIAPPVNSHAITFIPYLLIKVFPFISIEAITLYAPIFISSLIVIPIVLIGRLYGSTIWGFFSALIASIGWSYFNRTVAGYYDTDMFSVLFVVCILYFLLAALKKKDLKYSLLASVFIALNPYFYPSGQPIGFALALAFIGYSILMMIFNFFKIGNPFLESLFGEDSVFEDEENYIVKACIMVSLGMMSFHFVPHIFVGDLIALRFIVHAALWAGVFIALKNVKLDKNVWYIVGGVVFLFILINSGIIQRIIQPVIYYATRTTEDVSEQATIHFQPTIKTVREAQNIQFEEFANRISGSIPAIILAGIGFFLLLMRKKELFFLSIPLVGIGLFTFVGGLRFTIYAVPIAALSLTFLFGWGFSLFIKQRLGVYVPLGIVTCVLLVPHVQHAEQYMVGVVYSKETAQILTDLKDQVNEGDYAITWWDYGTGLWYYSGLNSITAPSHHTNDNYTTSRILSTSSAVEAANLSRLAVETFVKIHDPSPDKSERYTGFASAIEAIFQIGRDDQINTDEFLRNIKSSAFLLPKKTRDVYLFLPHEMIDIFPVIHSFSNLNLKNGRHYEQMKIERVASFQDAGNDIALSNGLFVDKQSGRVRDAQGNPFPINTLDVVEYDAERKINVQSFSYDRSSPWHIIFHKAFGRFYICDSAAYNSLFFQMFFFDRYDARVFEPVVLDPLAKVYRFKY